MDEEDVVTDPLRERLIARLTSRQPHVPVLAAEDLADAVLEILDGEVARLRRIENAARTVMEKYRGVSPVELDHLDDFGLVGVLDALAAEVERTES